MKPLSLLLLAITCLASVITGYSQTGTRTYATVEVEIIKEKKPKKISAYIEAVSTYPDNDSSWALKLQDSLNKYLRYKNGAKPEIYLVSMRFLIERDGSINTTQCINDPGYGLCEQVRLSILRSDANRWRPSLSTKESSNPTMPANAKEQ